MLVPDPRDLRGLIATMRRTHITAMSGVNTLFNALTNAPDFAKLDFSELKFAIGGGAAVQRSVATRWQEATGSPLVEGYGLTEASPVVCINPLAKPKIGTVGLPVPSTEVTIRDDNGHSVAIGESGEVWVRGPQVMQGYWGHADETRKVLTDDGWLQTGDIGVIDPQGFLKLLDRKKDMIIVSGFKVFPNEVEDVVTAASGRIGGGRHRCARRADRSGGEAVRRQARSAIERSGGAALLPRQLDRLQGSQADRVSRAAPEERRSEKFCGKSCNRVPIRC